MAADDQRTEFHLTPDGWVRGTSKDFGDLRGEEVQRPDNAVETWEQRIYQRSQYSREELTHTLLWHDPELPHTKRVALRRSFDHPFERQPDRFFDE